MHINDRSLTDETTETFSGLDGLMKSVGAAADTRSYPPVEKWNPPYCGEIGLRIASDGTWFYQGSPIGRKRLVKLFSSVLRKDEDGKTYLVTPVEKIGIDVDDAHFLAVEMSRSGEGEEQTLTFRTNVDDVVTVGPDNPIRFQTMGAEDSDATLEEGGLKPYIMVRGRLEALVTRALYYDLIDLAVCKATPEGDKIGLWSGGTFFVISDWNEDLLEDAAGSV